MLRLAKKLCAHGVSDFLDGLNVITRNELVVGIKELDTRLLERALG